ncbi:hypothetical protein GGTG_11111 [Gaeumannomyces tritici R3-111a-1]|uniref:Uncharacterized protein n=1 Tax=Gaeumannomyces tritici (strain R3-111a-1) TaxID=644352 RepID=J3PC88_GAET3|nr:hypothetical protein GGTG_11111 [Gaeumannomyces tritici R3-111a-1]EJT71858.1 hypothetical protein GGTG_11111 [Gaeumannomyces tritici R3-111a-1]
MFQNALLVGLVPESKANGGCASRTDTARTLEPTPFPLDLTPFPLDLTPFHLDLTPFPLDLTCRSAAALQRRI